MDDHVSLTPMTETGLGDDATPDAPPQRRGGVVIIPTLLTLSALAAGLSAVKYSSDGATGLALGLVALAAVLDMMDGRVARMLHAQSKMGAELDSLCDAIGFGVTPALIVYFTLIHGRGGGLGDLGWVAALVYAAAIVLRLARFNTLLDDDEQPVFHKEFFSGVPSPPAGLLALAPVVAFVKFGHGWWTDPYLASGWLVCIAALAFSRIPTLSMKTVRVNPRLLPFILAGFVILVAALVTQPLVTALVLGFGYLLHIPFAVRTYAWLSSHPDAWAVQGAERRAIKRETRRRPRPRPPRRRPRLRV